MGLKDIVTRRYMSRKDVFADAFNFFCFGGNLVVDPDKLENLPVAETKISGDAKPDAMEKERDILKRAVVMKDDKACYVILGIENQSYIDYAMPARMLVYDALNYDMQLREIAERHKAEQDGRGRSKDEWLSGFYGDDCLEPVLSLVVYFGSEEEWDAPRTLHGMMRIPDGFKEFIPDYRLNLLTPWLPCEEDYSKFRTDLNAVLGFLRCSKEKKKLKEFMERHEGDFRHLATGAGLVLKACAKMNLLAVDETEEEIDMCQAIQEMIDEKIAEIRIEIDQIKQEKAQIEQKNIQMEHEKAQMEQEKAQMEQKYATEKTTFIRNLKKLHAFSDETIAEILNISVALVKSVDA